jgi:hypothetical protein
VRYYSITITDPVSSAIWAPTATGQLVKGPAPNAGTAGVSTSANGVSVVTVSAKAPFSPKYSFTSHPNGPGQLPDPGALNLEIDLPVSQFHTPQGGGTFRLHGVGLRMIGQSSNLNGQNVVLSAGMGKGLPLATAAYNAGQSGIILQGQIWQAWGNWVGTEQTLDFVVFPGDLTPAGGVSFNWQAGQSLASAIATSLTQAFPKYKQSINIAALQVPRGATQADTQPSLMTFAAMLVRITQPIGAKQYKDYPGVTATTDGKTIYVFDRTVPPAKTVKLAFQDLIGQPTWLDSATISFQTVMRSDIDINDYITFPSGIVSPYAQLTPGSVGPNVPAQSKSVFQGTFAIIGMQHFGNFRQPDAASWNTTFRAAVVNPSPIGATLLTSSLGL